MDDHRPSGWFELFDIDRKELTPDVLQTTLVNVVPIPSEEDRPVDVFILIHLRVETQDWIAIDETGRVFSISHIVANGGYATRRTMRPVTLQRYSGQHGSYDVASANALIGGKMGKMVMIHNESGIQVIWSAV